MRSKIIDKILMNLKDEKLKLKDKVYICDKCSTKMDRDLNAAINIKNEGYRLYMSM